MPLSIQEASLLTRAHSAINQSLGISCQFEILSRDGITWCYCQTHPKFRIVLNPDELERTHPESVQP